MEIDEAIKRCEEVAEENQRIVDTGIVFDDVTIDMLYCDDTEVIDEHLANYQRYAEEYKQLAQWLRELKELREQIRWIPCNERLPEDCTEVFVYLFDNSCPHIAWFKDTYWYTEDFEVEREDEPIAWMPLPEPARLDGKEAET